MPHPRCRQTILVVDDSPPIHRLIAVQLFELDVEVIDAASGGEGLALARRLNPDVLLLDVGLPDMSGLKVLSALKADAATHPMPVVLLSNTDDREKKLAGFDLGATDWILKPFDPIELCARVRSALRTRRLLDLLASQAQLDGLTGLHNRRYFDQRLASEIAESQRYGQPLGLLLIDADHFKRINDTMGHPRGDQVLRGLADLIQDVCRTSDIACRIGGEEFALMLPRADTTRTLEVAGRLRREVEHCRLLRQLLGRPLTVSIGAVSADADDLTTPALLVEAADRALYQAKTAGRNRIRQGTLGAPRAA